MYQLRLIFLAVTLLIAACNLAPENDGATATAQIPQIPTAANTPVLESTPSTRAPVPPVSRGITVTLWTNQEFAPDDELPGGLVLLEQLNAFDSSHPDVNLSVELKTVSDQGGSLSYLRTGRSVAPTILPDVVLLPTTQLRDAAAQGLIYPLDNLIAAEMLEDLYPVAQEMVRIDDQVYGYPFALTNLQHLAYDSSVITQTVSSNWSELVATPPARFIFPAAGPMGAELTLQFYQENGGTLVNDLGQPHLEVEPLTAALEEIRRGITNNFIDVQSGSAATIEQAWQIFQSSPGYIVQTNTDLYLHQQLDGELRGTYQTLPLPGPNGPLAPRVNAWTWAISTPDPARQAIAAELISWLGSSQNMGEWALQSAILPARRSSFDMWPNNRYVTFLQNQLARAQQVPLGFNNTVRLALGDATTGVILGLSTVEDAAAEAASAVEP